jgi:hypothetical protein
MAKLAYAMTLEALDGSTNILDQRRDRMHSR